MLTLLLSVLAAATTPGVPVHVTPDNVVFRAAPPPFPAGAQLAVLEGKPGESFPYALRLRLPAGTALTQATRAKPASVTVLSGSVTVDGSAFPAGSYFTITPFAGDLVASEESVVQVSGEGPWLKGALDVAPSVEATIPVRNENADLQLIDTTPPSSSDVTAETVVRVRVRYNVRDFQPNLYRLDAMFESTRAGASVGVPTTTPGAAPYALTSASGEMTIDVPLNRLLTFTNVARPLHMWIFLLRKTGERTSRTVVRTPTVVFNAK
jgi:hypothetical protein